MVQQTRWINKQSFICFTFRVEKTAKNLISLSYDLSFQTNFLRSMFVPKWSSDVRLDGKTAIVTGANTGIGKETAKDFAGRGKQTVWVQNNERHNDLEYMLQWHIILEYLCVNRGKTHKKKSGLSL